MKLMGLVIIFFASAFTGLLKSEEIKEREKQFLAFIDFLYFIQREVSLYLTPQCEIYNKFTNPTLEKIGFLGALRSGQFEDSKIWRAICNTREKITLPQEALDVIKGFSENFGKLSADEEIKNGKRIIETLEEIYKRYKSDLEQKAVLYRTLGFVVGIGLVLLLW